MAIVLNNITSGYNLSTINSNFQKIEDYVNDKLLARADTGVAGEAMMERALDMNGNKILNVYVDVDDANSLLTVGVADSRYYNVDGDTLTGPMNANSQIISNLPSPTASSQAATKEYVDDGDANLQSQFNKTLRFPGNIPQSAVGPSGYQNALQGYNNQGVPVPVFSYTDTADLAIKLASNADNEGASLIGMSQGGTLQQTLKYFTPEQSGAVGDGITDDSDAVQAALNKAADAAIASPSGIFIPQTVKINSTFRITKTLTVNGAKVRVEGGAGGCLYFDPAGTYTNSRGIVVTNNANLAAFIGNAKPLFSGISFLTTGNTLDLFYAVRGDAVSPNNGACLHHITSCVFRGFNRLFTHGAGGWGWVWMSCTATNTQFWLYLTSEADTYERHSFFGCQWGSGGTALYINNSNGKVYWEAGSVDYCTSIATVVSGHFSMSGHYEFTGRTASLIDITGSNASVSLEGMWAIVGNTSTVWYLVNQYQDYQLSIDKMTVIHDGNNAGSGLFSNKKFRKGYIYFPSDAAKLMGYFSSDSELLLDSSGYFDFSLSNSALTTASISGGQLRYTGVGGSGATSYLYVDIPIHGASQISFMLTASYTSTIGPMVMTKQLLTAGKTVITTLTEGTASWPVGSSSVAGGMRTMKEIPPGASFLRLIFNGFYLNSTTSFNIESLKLWRA